MHQRCTDMNDDIKELKSLCNEIDEPESFYVGLTQKKVLPYNILAFHRNPNTYSIEEWRQSHEHYLLIISLGGEGKTWLDGIYDLGLKESNALIVQTYQTHYHQDMSKSYDWLFISFNSDDKDFFLNTEGKTFSVSGEVLDELKKFIRDYKRSANLDIQKRLPARLHLIITLLKEKSLTVPNSAKEKTIFIEVGEYIKMNMKKAISIADIANKIGISSGHLRAVFKNKIGISLGQFIKSTKLYHAQRLLGTSNMSIKEITASCGYESVSTFSRTFKAYTGMSPKDFRKKSTT